MVEFGGWSMPVQYSDLSLAASHLHTRYTISLALFVNLVCAEIVYTLQGNCVHFVDIFTLAHQFGRLLQDFCGVVANGRLINISNFMEKRQAQK